MSINYFEWAGCITGLVGALLLSLNNRLSKFGFVSFLLSNIAWLIYAVQIGSVGLFVTQAVFMLTSCMGIWTWMFKGRFGA